MASTTFALAYIAWGVLPSMRSYCSWRSVTTCRIEATASLMASSASLSWDRRCLSVRTYSTTVDLLMPSLLAISRTPMPCADRANACSRNRSLLAGVTAIADLPRVRASPGVDRGTDHLGASPSLPIRPSSSGEQRGNHAREASEGPGPGPYLRCPPARAARQRCFRAHRRHRETTRAGRTRSTHSVHPLPAQLASSRQGGDHAVRRMRRAGHAARWRGHGAWCRGRGARDSVTRPPALPLVGLPPSSPRCAASATRGWHPGCPAPSRPLAPSPPARGAPQGAPRRVLQPAALWPDR